jgi:hypothetical protein
MCLGPSHTEAAYRRDIESGRIQAADIRFALERESNTPILDARLDRWTLRRTTSCSGCGPSARTLWSGRSKKGICSRGFAAICPSPSVRA